MSTDFFNDQWRMPNNKNQSLVSNYSMKFDGISDVVRVDETVLPEYSSVSLWFKTSAVTSSSNFDQLLGGGDGNVGTNLAGYFQYLSIRSNKIVNFGGSTTGYFELASTAVNDGAWHNLILTWDPTTAWSGTGSRGTLKAYLDGTLTSTTDTDGYNITWDSASTLRTIGNYGTTNTNRPFDGTIDQVSVFDYELSSSQISTLYGGGTAVGNPMSLSPKPVAYYQLGDKSAYNGANYLVPNNSLQDYVFDFNPIDLDYISTTAYTITASATVSAWFNVNTVGAYAILGRSTGFGGNYYGFIDDVGGKIRVLLRDTINTFSLKVTTEDYNANTWYHLAITQTSGVATVYINGTNQGTLGARVPSLDLIGSYQSTFLFNGKLSNIAIWNTNLSSTDIEAIYNNGSPNDISSLNPTHWWKLNAQDTFDGTNWTIKDYAGSNDGTSSGMTSGNLVQSDLQRTSGYSPYALSLDGIDDNITLDNTNNFLNVDYLTISIWFKPDVAEFATLIGNRYFNNGFMSWAVQTAPAGRIRYIQKTPGVGGSFYTTDTYNLGEWNHVAVTYSSGVAKIYLNGGTPITLATFLQPIQYDTGFVSTNVTIGSAPAGGSPAAPTGPTQFFDGQLSNVAIWNSGLSSSEITEIYNQGVPSNLNTFSGTKPTAWWELGSNSSFNSSTWTALSNGTAAGGNAVSTANMANDDITNGPGYSASGLGTSSIDIVGDAPYSPSNGLSENIDASDRVNDVPS